MVFNIKGCYFLKQSVWDQQFCYSLLYVFNAALSNFPIKAIHFPLVAHTHTSFSVPPPSLLNVTQVHSYWLFGDSLIFSEHRGGAYR